MDRPPRDPRDQLGDDQVPLFGTWPRIYTAVVLAHLAVMGLVALFSRWPG